MSSEQRVKELRASIKPIQQEISSIIHEEFDSWEPTDEQKEDLSTRFWKWINEGMNHDYWPCLDEPYRRDGDKIDYPWFVQDMITYKSDDPWELQEAFEPKGVEFE